MLLHKTNINFFRNFSKTAYLLLRGNQQQIQEIPIPPTSAKESEKNEIKITKFRKDDKNDIKKLAQLVTYLRSNKKREQENQIIIEGNQLIKEAVEAKIQLNKLIFSDQSKIKEVTDMMGKSCNSVDFIKVPQSEMSFYSVLQTCPGLIGIFTKPEPPPEKMNALPITLISDNVREPQNLGSIIRVSNAVPIKNMLVPKGNVNFWDTKTIRGSCGSIFHFPVYKANWDEIDEKISKDNLVLIADNNVREHGQNNALNYDGIPKELLKDRNIILIIGGETHGVSDEACNFASKRDYRIINIPLDKTVDSLNVSTALGIILFELRRVLKN